VTGCIIHGLRNYAGLRARPGVVEAPSFPSRRPGIAASFSIGIPAEKKPHY
jgi:hypothetical protein